MGLEVATDHRDDLDVVTLTGELDIYTVPAFRRAVADLDPAASQVVLDLRGIALLDSSGLGTLIALRSRANEGGREVGLACPHAHLMRVFEVTGLGAAFAFGDDVDEAITALASYVPPPPET